MPAKGQYKANAKKRSIQQREYNSTAKQKKRRAERNKSRAIMAKAGKVRKGDGKDVHHKDHNTSNTKRSNLKAIPKSKNRAMNKRK